MPDKDSPQIFDLRKTCVKSLYIQNCKLAQVISISFASKYLIAMPNNLKRFFFNFCLVQPIC